MNLRGLAAWFFLSALPLAAQPAADLYGQVRDGRYVSPTGAFTVEIPVLPELGGRIADTPSTVTFDDNFSVHESITAFPLDATQRWERQTQSAQDYLAYFFRTFVMPDFVQHYPGARVESAAFMPKFAGGALLTYLLIPGGSFFESHGTISGFDPRPPVIAKRGNLTFVKNGFIFLLSIELTERATERSLWKKTPQEEDDILEHRLLDLVQKMDFPAPSPDAGG